MADIATLDDLYAAFTALNMEGGWHRRFPALWAQPRANFLPHQWRYADVKPILARAGELIGTDKAERRNLTMFNPVEGNVYSTLRSMVAAYQMIRPGETARAHRHTPNALRLILEGRGTYTVVDGHQVEMRPGDVLLTPAWAWHSHDNVGPDDCYWMDFLDVPLVHLLEPMFYEPHPDGVEADPVPVASSPLAFRREDTLARLDVAGAVDDAHASVQLGDPALKTIRLDMQRLVAGRETARCRTTANIIYAVVEGHGQTEIDGQTFNWSFGDTVAIPAWRPYRHRAQSDALLLKVSDAPVMAAFDWLRSAAD
ncbi:cupin domain-containing protein [Novosphingobium humi]|uniref:Cupin domain-containing protein n=1 Tax=Novosphingobium humi TaxID=2282397 RepID=A0ABY7U390_9SPHN|nr:cupin domain-containing protein [Novosphingobium humi]WCT79951.1 cupin domain-containing protein [Novosphingobium humi]WJT00885.1 cupin domain-containing protein [Novosphingobium humi]